MVVGLGAYSIRPDDKYCPSPSAALVAALFAPCLAFDRAMGREVSKKEAVQMGLLTSDEHLVPAPPPCGALTSCPPAGFLESGRAIRLACHRPRDPGQVVARLRPGS